MSLRVDGKFFIEPSVIDKKIKTNNPIEKYALWLERDPTHSISKKASIAFLMCVPSFAIGVITGLPLLVTPVIFITVILLVGISTFRVNAKRREAYGEQSIIKIVEEREFKRLPIENTTTVVCLNGDPNIYNHDQIFKSPKEQFNYQDRIRIIKDPEGKTSLCLQIFNKQSNENQQLFIYYSTKRSGKYPNWFCLRMAPRATREVGDYIPSNVRKIMIGEHETYELRSS